MLVQDLAHAIQRQTDHAVGIIGENGDVDARQERAVQFSPGHAVGHESLGAEVVDHAGPAQLVHGRGPVVRGARLFVELGGRI
jgi:hypothetical protein